MSGTPEWIERLLAADPRDVGCDEVMAVMHVYVDRRAAGLDPEERYVGVTSHLDSCGACAESVRGLLAAVVDADLQNGMDTSAPGRAPLAE
ncbi:hypothetical protein ACFRFH_04725 [Leifsonia sp. NPDC056824]|uniref:hypothetical protein n=1 Tax=Leifsonia sp. NPDC056824 TaxID=3345953 RepID=UPI0036760E17